MRSRIPKMIIAFTAVFVVFVLIFGNIAISAGSESDPTDTAAASPAITSSPTIEKTTVSPSIVPTQTTDVQPTASEAPEPTVTAVSEPTARVSASPAGVKASGAITPAASAAGYQAKSVSEADVTATLQFKKHSAAYANPVEGAVFSAFNQDANDNPIGDAVAVSAPTNKDGRSQITLPVGSFRIIETTYPPGYTEIFPCILDVNVDADGVIHNRGTIDHVEYIGPYDCIIPTDYIVKFKNTQTNRIIMCKLPTSVETPELGSGIAGAGFTFYAWNDKTAAYDIVLNSFGTKEYITANTTYNWQPAVISSPVLIEPNKKYLVKETKVPAGYDESKPYSFYIQTDENGVPTFSVSPEMESLYGEIASREHVLTGTVNYFVFARNVEKPKQPELSFEKRSDPANGSEVREGQIITYSIDLTNKGDADATGVTVTDSIPKGTSFVPGTATGGISPIEGTLTWDGIVVPKAEGGIPGKCTVSFQVTVDQLTDGDTAALIENTAKVGGTPTNETKHDVRKPVISGYKTSDPETGSIVRAGDIITYTIAVSNNGTGASDEIGVSDRIPDGTTYVDGSATGGGLYDADSNTVTWTLSGLEAKDTVKLSFQVRVNKLPDNVYNATITNAAMVNDTKTNETEHPQEKFVKLPSAQELRPGDAVDYRLTGIGNSRGVEALEYSISDLPPEGLLFKRANVPAFNMGSALTYSVQYRTNLTGDAYTTLYTGIPADAPYSFDAPALQSGEHITEIMLYFDTVPVGFAMGDEIVYTFEVSASNTARELINRGEIASKVGETSVDVPDEPSPQGPPKVVVPEESQPKGAPEATPTATPVVFISGDDPAGAASPKPSVSTTPGAGGNSEDGDGSATLIVTGEDISILWIIGGVALACGALVVIARRKREKTQ